MECTYNIPLGEQSTAPKTGMQPAMQLIYDWEDAAEARGLSPSSARQYMACLVRFLLDTRLVGLTEATDLQVVVYLTRMGPRGPSRKLATKALRSFYRWAEATGRMENDPTARIP